MIPRTASDRSRIYGLNAICPYYTMFPIDFPRRLLRTARRGDWVLDPFCGRGTTNFAARLSRLGSIGIDVSPVATAVTKAKFAHASPDDVAALCSRLLQETAPKNVPQGDFWNLCFHSKTLEDICALREALLESCETDCRILLRGLVMGILHGPRNAGPPTYLSNQMPRTYATKPSSAVHFWHKRNLKPVYVDVADAVKRRAAFSLAHLPIATPGYAVQADSKTTDFGTFGVQFKWVITSPPYFQMNTYVPDQWLRGWFVGGPAAVDYTTDGQLSMGTRHDFADNLGVVWTKVAESCAQGAHLHVRLGSLPSNPCDPAKILRESVQRSGALWRLRSLRPAGHAGLGRRQASQFGRKPGSAVEEFDLHATLDE